MRVRVIKYDDTKLLGLELEPTNIPDEVCLAQIAECYPRMRLLKITEGKFTYWRMQHDCPNNDPHPEDESPADTEQIAS